MLLIKKFSKAECKTIEYQGDSSQYYYNYPEVQLANESEEFYNYFASDMNSHVGVASCNNSKYVASAYAFNEYHDQEPMFAENSLSFDSASNIQHVNPYSSAISSQDVISPQNKPMNERIGFDDVDYLANYSPNSTPYANCNTPGITIIKTCHVIMIIANHSC